MEPTHFESLYPPNTRENEITKILSFIKEGNSCQVISLPGGGRSNLLGLLSYNRNVRLKHLGENQKWFHFVLCNFAEVRKRALFDTTKFLFLNLIASLRERGMSSEAGSRFAGKELHQKTSTIFKKSLSFNDELVLFQGLKRTIDLLAIEKELTVVFLFDRFEDYIPTVTPEFFTNLRVLRDRAKYRFSVVFSIHKPLEDLIGQDLLSDFYQFVAGHTVYLPLLDKPGLDFRIAYMEKVSGKTLKKETIDAILKVTTGHPNLTRLGIETAIDMNQESRIMNHGFENFLLEQKPMKAALFDIWKSLTPEEQTSLVQSSKLKVKSSGEYLESVGIIKNNKITIPLFAESIKQFSKESAHIMFDPNTHDITKRNLILSDTLTSSEFKLLKHLLQDPNRVIERDEIVSAVWADTKSIAGVTDQALDQLIFRVRRKIEDDPNKPTHLQTVKGRGFRFIP